MLDMLGTPWITSTSPGCARLCASNSAIRLTCRRAPSSGSMRWRMLRTVSAGPTMVLPGMVGRSTDAPMTPDGMPSSSMVSEMMPVGSPSAMSRSTTPCGARGTAISLMFSAAMRPVNRFVSATVTGAPPDHQALLYHATLTCSRAAHKATHRGRSAWALRRLFRCGCWRRARAMPTLQIHERLRRRVGKIACGERAIRAGTAGAICPRGRSATRTALPEGAIAVGPLALDCAARYRCRLSGTAVCIPTEFGPRPLISSTRAHGEPDVHLAEGRTSKGQSP